MINVRCTLLSFVFLLSGITVHALEFVIVNKTASSLTAQGLVNQTITLQPRGGKKEVTDGMASWARGNATQVARTGQIRSIMLPPNRKEIKSGESWKVVLPDGDALKTFMYGSERYHFAKQLTIELTTDIVVCKQKVHRRCHPDASVCEPQQTEVNVYANMKLSQLQDNHLYEISYNPEERVLIVDVKPIEKKSP